MSPMTGPANSLLIGLLIDPATMIRPATSFERLMNQTAGSFERRIKLWSGQFKLNVLDVHSPSAVTDWRYRRERVLDCYLHGVDAEGFLEAVDTLLELLLLKVQQGLGAHGSGAALARQRPRLVVVLLLPQDVSQQAVQGGSLLLLQLPPNYLLCLEWETKETNWVEVIIIFKQIYQRSFIIRYRHFASPLFSSLSLFFSIQFIIKEVKSFNLLIWSL